MRRLAALAAIPVLVGLPPWLAPTWAVGLVSAASFAFCLGAVRRASLRTATMGGMLALIALMLALRDPDSRPHMLVAAVFGMALLLLLDGVYLQERLDGADIAPRWWRRRLGWWTARAAFTLAIAIVVASLAPLIAMTLPPLSGSVLAGLGVLAAFAAALALAWPRKEE
jgi:hypothetical protein